MYEKEQEIIQRDKEAAHAYFVAMGQPARFEKLRKCTMVLCKTIR